MIDLTTFFLLLTTSPAFESETVMNRAPFCAHFDGMYVGKDEDNEFSHLCRGIWSNL